ncbi:MAG TPA: DUF3857 domain-containing transglutaminase family protein [Verrucomicrobiae bacterium]|jgi:hypothetical protein
MALAQERIQVNAVPAWVVACSYDATFRGRTSDAVTHLLVSRQVHAECRQTHFHFVRRLETMQAVQHESQWRLAFEPRTQSVTLHWIRIRRGDVEIDHAIRNNLRLLQREEGLEGFVIDGWCTALLVIEDVRPGDILDVCYTIENHPRLLPESCTSFFTLPQGTVVGCYAFYVWFNEARTMRWKSSAADLAPAESRGEGMVVWSWMGVAHEAPKPEANTPDWFIAFPWIQISDCADWRMVASAVCACWAEDAGDPTLDDLAREIEAGSADLLARVERAIQLVQDDHRYLSVNVEFGGQVPSPPGAVARRRFGDCKDLSFLLVHLLRRLGVAARPVLVNAGLGRSVAQLLPMPGLFNHVVVEFELQGQTRWVDATIKRQGGGPLGRIIPDFGVGLPVDPAAGGLIETPRASLGESRYELRETILLDTTGAASAIAVVVQATGAHSDNLRRQFDTHSIEELAKERLQLHATRFPEVKRLGALQYRDDRAANEFVQAEIIEVNHVLIAHATPGLCQFPLPATLVGASLKLPEKEARRTPFALPHPCQVAHTIDIEFPTLEPFSWPRCDLDSAFLQFSRRHKSLHGYLSVAYKLNLRADSVPPEMIEKHRTMVESVLRESGGVVTLPVGYARPRMRRNFGELPPPAAPPGVMPFQPKLGPGSAATPASAGVPDQPIAFTTPELPEQRNRSSRAHHGQRRRHRSKQSGELAKALIIAGVIVAAVFGLIIIMTRGQ